MTKPVIALEFATIDQLDIAPENPRSQINDNSIFDLADNIEIKGILTPLMAYKKAKRFQVVGGGRRLRALRHLLERKSIAPDMPIPLTIIPKDQATEAGIIDNLSREKLSDYDEVILFTSPALEHMTDASIARHFGRSAKYVAQRRKIASLPKTVMALFQADVLNFDKMMGLSYFANEPEDVILDWAKQANASGWMTGDRLRQEYLNGQAEWENRPEAKFVTREAYIDAGGALESDLFVETTYVVDPKLMRQLAEDSIRKTAMDTLKQQGWKWIEECDADTQFWNLEKHQGIEQELTLEETSELEAIEAMNDPSEDDAERYDALYEKQQEAHYPEHLRALTGVRWKINMHSADGYKIQEGAVNPDDVPALVDANFWDAPLPLDNGENPDGVEDGPTPLPQRVLSDERKIILHAARQELAKNPDLVLRILADRFVAHSFDLSVSRDPVDQILETGTEVTNSDAIAKNNSVNDQVAADKSLKSLPLSKVKQVLAHALLPHLNAVPKLADLDVNLRTYWTPDAAYFKAHQISHLITAIISIDPEQLDAAKAAGTPLETLKKADLVTLATKLAKKHPDWIPERMKP
jgi:ParB/RepB/Spo0J family partition protein